MDLPLEKSTEKARNLVVSGIVGLISVLSGLFGTCSPKDAVT